MQPLHGPFLIQEPVQQRAARSLRRLDSPRNRVGVGFHRMSVWILICLVAIAEEEVKPPLMHDRDAQIGADETDRLGVESWGPGSVPAPAGELTNPVGAVALVAQQPVADLGHVGGARGLGAEPLSRSDQRPRRQRRKRDTRQGAGHVVRAGLGDDECPCECVL